MPEEKVSEKRFRLDLKDYITLLTIAFMAGGGWFQLNQQEIIIDELKSRITKTEAINPQLIEYRLTQIEVSVREIKDLLKKP